METKIQEIQPTGAEQWLRQDAALRDPALIPPVTRVEKRGEAKTSTQNKPLPGTAPTTAMGKEKAGELVDEVQSYLNDINIQLSFDLSEETGDMVVRVIDRNTGEVIRQIPPENLMEIRERLKELQGVLLNDRV
ncbi:MAG: flagellar protein FlaG [Syntrophobacteraceae bacterium]|nr:flagellar protein FlaG [Syntrophobacteraceae bacterium]